MSPNGDLERAKQRMQLVEHEMRDGGLERVDQHRAMLYASREMVRNDSLPLLAWQQA